MNSSRPIHLTQEEWNSLCNIKHYAGELYDYLESEGILKQHMHEVARDTKFSRALYVQIRLRDLLGKE